jgi:hypothetical protein
VGQKDAAGRGNAGEVGEKVHRWRSARER